MMLPMIGPEPSSSTDEALFIPDRSQWKDAPGELVVRERLRAAVRADSDASSSEGTPEEKDAPLEDVARAEREYVRQRLRAELGREPTEEEVDEWLRQHTEGY
jgi:hypothetical protein